MLRARRQAKQQHVYRATLSTNMMATLKNSCPSFHRIFTDSFFAHIFCIILTTCIIAGTTMIQPQLLRSIYTTSSTIYRRRILAILEYRYYGMMLIFTTTFVVGSLRLRFIRMRVIVVIGLDPKICGVDRLFASLSCRNNTITKKKQEESVVPCCCSSPSFVRRFRHLPFAVSAADYSLPSWRTRPDLGGALT